MEWAKVLKSIPVRLLIPIILLLLGGFLLVISSSTDLKLGAVQVGTVDASYRVALFVIGAAAVCGSITLGVISVREGDSQLDGDEGSPEITSAPPLSVSGPATTVVTLDSAGDFSPGALLKDARDVKVMGRSLVNIFNQYSSQMASIVRNGGRVAVIVIEPVPEISKYIYPSMSNGDQIFENHVRAISGRIRYIRGMIGANSRFEVRTIPFFPSYSMLLARGVPNGDARLIAQVNFLYTRTERDRPLLCFKEGDSWFDTFEQEFEEIWDRGTPWEEPVWVTQTS